MEENILSSGSASFNTFDWSNEGDNILWSLDSERSPTQADKWIQIVGRPNIECDLRLKTLKSMKIAKIIGDRLLSCESNMKIAKGGASKPENKLPKTSVYIHVICLTDGVGRVLGHRNSNLERIQMTSNAAVRVQQCTGYFVFTATAQEEPSGPSPTVRAGLELFPYCGRRGGDKSFTIQLLLAGNYAATDIGTVLTGATVTVTPEGNPRFVDICGEKEEVKGAFILMLDLMRRNCFKV